MSLRATEGGLNDGDDSDDSSFVPSSASQSSNGEDSCEFHEAEEEQTEDDFIQIQDESRTPYLYDYQRFRHIGLFRRPDPLHTRPSAFLQRDGVGHFFCLAISFLMGSLAMLSLFGFRVSEQSNQNTLNDCLDATVPMIATLSYPRNLYAVLGVSRNATREDIKRATRRRKGMLHSDKITRHLDHLLRASKFKFSGSDIVSPIAANMMFHVVQAAATVLNDDEQRNKYDKGSYYFGASKQHAPGPFAVHGDLKTDWWDCMQRRSRETGACTTDAEKDTIFL